MPKPTKAAKPKPQPASSPAAAPAAAPKPALKVIPHPGYTTTKRKLAPVRLMLLELGRQDASIQLQELSLSFLESTAQSMGVRINDFLKILYQARKIPHGSYQFEELRQVFINSQITLTHAHLERMLKGVIELLRTRLRASSKPLEPVGWRTQKNKANLAPLQQLEENLPTIDSKRLASCPEFALLEYYRLVRVANAHMTDETRAHAEDAFKALTAVQLEHFEGYELLAPNLPSSLKFDDFLLFTRAVKYYANVINDVCA